MNPARNSLRAAAAPPRPRLFHGRGSFPLVNADAAKRSVRTLVHVPEGGAGGRTENGIKTLPEIRRAEATTSSEVVNAVNAVTVDISKAAVSLKKSAVQIQQDSNRKHAENAPWWLTPHSDSASPSSGPYDLSDNSSSADDVDMEGSFPSLGSMDGEGGGLTHKISFEVGCETTVNMEGSFPSLGSMDGKCALDLYWRSEPNYVATRKFFDLVSPHLKARSKGGVASSSGLNYCFLSIGESHTEYMNVFRDQEMAKAPPFELVVLEAALLVATGQLDAERRVVANQVQGLMAKLPGNVNPVNLEELRRVKSVLVELETKAQTVRRLLEELMDDDDEMRELNLSSRPVREERRRQREREKLERELERAREAKGQLEDNADRHAGAGSSRSQSPPSTSFSPPGAPGPPGDAGSTEGAAMVDVDFFSHLGRETKWESKRSSESSSYEHTRAQTLGGRPSGSLSVAQTRQGARDLEESIRVSLSAARYEVDRLELTLSIGSFAAALGAMLAGIFGMNMRSTLEMSVRGFWLTTVGIILGCCLIFWRIMAFTKNRKII
eukprot:gene8766-33630_t